MSRVLVFFPHNPFPPRSGAHQRLLQMTQGWRALGAEVVLASSTHTSDTEWANIPPEQQRNAGISSIELHHAGVWDRRYIKYAGKLARQLHRPARLDSANYAPPGLKRWFQGLVRRTNPDIIVMNYAFWGRLVTLPLHRTTTSVIDSHDLVSLYRPRYLVMERWLTSPPFSPATVDPQFLREDFFDEFNFQVSAQEYAIYDAYKYTVAITPGDAKLISENTKQTRVLTIPMTQQICPMDNQYDGAALYTPGRNPFNIQGYLYFAARVLPRVLESEPGFRLEVTGGIGQDVLPVRGIELRGFVPDLLPSYRHAPFLICPILGKTGQQIKIVEAMAHGVPVIATHAAADGSPIQHGENGFVAGDAEEFATYALELWRDRALCKRLGHAARETIAEEFSQHQLLDGLRNILGQTRSE